MKLSLFGNLLNYSVITWTVNENRKNRAQVFSCFPGQNIHEDAVTGDYSSLCSMKASLPDFDHGLKCKIIPEGFFINLPGRFLLQQQGPPSTPTTGTSASTPESINEGRIINTGGNIHDKEIE